MKILLVNKYLYPKGGAEIYTLKLGAQLARMGHEVQYFGMENPQRCVSNHAGLYTSYMDFHAGSTLLQKASYPLRVIYSREAYAKMRRVLDDFAPDVVHFGNFNYQLTPAVLLAAVRWRAWGGRACRLIYTAHDCQLVCPSHLGVKLGEAQLCRDCARGGLAACVRHKCIHGSYLRSALGSAEAFYWRRRGVYAGLDDIICCSEFMLGQLSGADWLHTKLSVMHNFVDMRRDTSAAKRDYVLYFGRYSEEKGIRALLAACRALPGIRFIFAGDGPLAGEINAATNAENVGLLSGKTLASLVSAAKFSICPSEVGENCPLSVMESIACNTPVLGARIGGVPELIKDGENGLLFESGNLNELIEKIRFLWSNGALLAACTKGCQENKFDSVETYAEKLVNNYYR